MNIPEKFWNTAMGALGVLTIFLIVLVVKDIKSIGYVGANENITHTVSVSGTGDAVAIPDVATFSFTVTETAKAVVDAQNAATTKSNAAIKAMKDGGVAEKDIQTTSYNINPHYEYQTGVCAANGYCPNRQILTGYDVSQTTLVKVRDLKKAGTLFSTIGSLGVQNVNGLNFSVDDPDSVNAEARGEAIADAQAKAKELSRQLGVNLVRIVSFNESGGSRPPMPYVSMSKAMDAAQVAAPEIAPGEQKVTSNVEITYEIQ